MEITNLIIPGYNDDMKKIEKMCQWIKDIDGDELDDRVESSYNCQVNNPDTDGDGYKDGQEIRVGTDPIDPASNKDRTLMDPSFQ